jgi:hypothetical protein
MELYEFNFEGVTYRYSSGENITLNGNLYTAQAITRNDIKKDFNFDEASITMPQHVEPAPRFRAMNPFSPVVVSIMNESGIKLFAGRVGSCTFDIDKASATMKLLSLQGIMKTQVPYRTYSLSCSFSLYNEGCDVNKNSYKLTLTSFTLNALMTEITATALSAKANGYYSGGYLESNGEYNYISEHSGTLLKLLYPMQKLPAQINVYPGCDKTKETCKSKFNNEKNFGGFPFIPVKNPVTEGF